MRLYTNRNLERKRRERTKLDIHQVDGKYKQFFYSNVMRDRFNRKMTPLRWNKSVILVFEHSLGKHIRIGDFYKKKKKNASTIPSFEYLNHSFQFLRLLSKIIMVKMLCRLRLMA